MLLLFPFPWRILSISLPQLLVLLSFIIKKKNLLWILKNILFLKEACYCLSLLDVLCSILWNLYNYYKQFSECVQARITELRQPIEKELKVKGNFTQTIY